VKKALLFTVFLGCAFLGRSQKIDSIYFHLYTDSLKKGQHNYINVDGKLSNGNWMPLSANEITFTSSDGVFEGNELVIPENFKPEKVKVKAVLKSNPAIWREITIWIKRKPDPQLPTKDDILKSNKRNRNS
jgi:hypothetical protein